MDWSAAIDGLSITSHTSQCPSHLRGKKEALKLTCFADAVTHSCTGAHRHLSSSVPDSVSFHHPHHPPGSMRRWGHSKGVGGLTWLGRGTARNLAALRTSRVSHRTRHCRELRPLSCAATWGSRTCSSCAGRRGVEARVDAQNDETGDHRGKGARPQGSQQLRRQSRFQR